jgi:hypothetical protein
LIAAWSPLRIASLLLTVMRVQTSTQARSSSWTNQAIFKLMLMGATWETQEGRVWLILPRQIASLSLSIYIYIYIYIYIPKSWSIKRRSRVVNGGLNCIIQPFQPGSLTQDDIITCKFSTLVVETCLSYWTRYT